jgi:hypothetical protein
MSGIPIPEKKLSTKNNHLSIEENGKFIEQKPNS